MDGRRGEHLAALAADVEVGAEAAGLVVADVVAVGPGEVEVAPAAAGDHLEGLGERAVGVEQLDEALVARLAIRVVDVEHPEAGLGAADDADAVGGRLAPPVPDLGLVGGALALPRRDAGVLLAGRDRDHPPAAPGVGEGCIEVRGGRVGGHGGHEASRSKIDAWPSISGAAGL